MTTDETAATIKSLFSKWTERLGLAWWTIATRYYDDPSEVVQRFYDRETGDVVAARTYADWRYATATIDVNLTEFTDLSDDETERIVVHELLHILVNEMREGELHHEERVVTGLTKAVLWVEAAVMREMKPDV